MNAAALAPVGVEATDPSGAIRVILGPDGLPSTIYVADDWARRLRSTSFGQAVVDACRTASEQRAIGWLTNLASSRALDQPAADPVAPEPRPGLEGIRLPRSPEVVAGEILQAIDDFERQLDAPLEPVTGVGTAGFGKLSLAVTDYEVVLCTADPGWLSQRSHDELTEALGSAVASARTALAEAKAASPLGRAQQLLHELERSVDTSQPG